MVNKMMSNYKRYCPTCNNEIEYINKRSYNDALTINSICKK